MFLSCQNGFSNEQFLQYNDIIFIIIGKSLKSLRLSLKKNYLNEIYLFNLFLFEIIIHYSISFYYFILTVIIFSIQYSISKHCENEIHNYLFSEF